MRDLVVLVNLLPAPEASFENRGSIYPATALLLIGTALVRNGYRVKLIDGAYDEDYLDRIGRILREEGPSILYVGLSVMVTQIPFALSASKAVKRARPDVPVVWGGPHPTLYPGETLKDDHVDVVAVNEGTCAALGIAGALAAGTPLDAVPGIAYKDPGGGARFTGPSKLEGINDLPFFDFSLLEIERYLNPRTASVYRREFPRYEGDLRILPLLTGLGCPYKCQFCINVILKRRYRYRSARAIADEIKRLQKQYGANTFLFLDEDFFISKKRLLELMAICEAEDLHFNFRTWCRVDHFKESYLDAELLRRLSRIGHISIAMGGESANPEILLDLQKGITPEEILHSLRVVTESGSRIFPRYSFMVGLENESMEQIRNTYRFCLSMKRINPLVDIAGPFVFRLYPGSPIFERIVRKHCIRLPQTPEQWSNYVGSGGAFDEMPWVPEPLQRNKNRIAFYSGYAFYVLSGNASWSVKQAVKRILIGLSRFRIRHFFFSFPFEYWFFHFIQSPLGRRRRIT